MERDGRARRGRVVTQAAAVASAAYSISNLYWMQPPSQRHRNRRQRPATFLFHRHLLRPSQLLLICTRNPMPQHHRDPSKVYFPGFVWNLFWFFFLVCPLFWWNIVLINFLPRCDWGSTEKLCKKMFLLLVQKMGWKSQWLWWKFCYVLFG